LGEKKEPVTLCSGLFYAFLVALPLSPILPYLRYFERRVSHSPSMLILSSAVLVAPPHLHVSPNVRNMKGGGVISLYAGWGLVLFYILIYSTFLK
jgi:hypothetical protein